MTNENSESHAEQFEEHQKKKKCNLSGSEVFIYIEDEDTKMIKDNRKIQAKKNRAAQIKFPINQIIQLTILQKMLK